MIMMALLPSCGTDNSHAAGRPAGLHDRGQSPGRVGGAAACRATGVVSLVLKQTETLQQNKFICATIDNNTFEV